jgi:hemolysin III
MNSLYSPREEKANTITHLAGLLFGVVATVYLLISALRTSNNWLFYSYLVFGFFMCFSFLTSTLYHSAGPGKTKKVLQKLDHAAIFTFIAGSYTPFTLVVLRNEGLWGWLLFAVIWFAALGGMVAGFLKIKNLHRVEMVLYIAMGWVVVVAFKPLYDVLSAHNALNILWWLIGGGLSYTIGAIVYSIKKIEFVHALWHLFVLAGAVCHTICIFLISKYF